jgi:peptidoglycan-N-acetylglucosamine deacetylase
MRASLWAHGLGLASLAVMPAAWPQVLGGLALNHGLLACGMHPRSAMLGPNLTRLPDASDRIALTFDDGPDPEITPRVLDLLDHHGATATFFVIGRHAAIQGALMREMLRRGHRIANHTYQHSAAFAAWGPWRQRRDIADAQDAIADACGEWPHLFRAPMGLRNPLLDPILALEGLSLVSWTRRGYDTLSRSPDRVLARLTRGLSAGDILVLHDTRGYHDTAPTPMVLRVLPRLLDAIGERGLRAVAWPGVAAHATKPTVAG